MSRASAATVLAVILAATAGCGGDDLDPREGNATSAEASASTGAPTSDGAAASPSVEPATGPVAEGSAVRYRLPAGDWALQRNGLTAVGSGDGGIVTIGFQSSQAFVSDVDDLARRAQRDGDWEGGRPALLENRTVGGEEAYVLESVNGEGFQYEIGIPSDIDWYRLHFTFPEDTPQARESIEQVLASVEWK